LPKVSKFAEVLQNLGISEDSHVVIYDLANGGNPHTLLVDVESVWFKKVQVLSGGFQKAEKLGIATNSGEEYSIKTEINAPENWLLKTSTLEEVERNCGEFCNCN
jgi:thiosulfate/3-mercaptopyruvate sulfurtransferase